MLKFNKQIYVDEANGSVSREWGACVYFVDSNELSYCASDPETADFATTFLSEQVENILSNWISANEGLSEFSSDNRGVFTDLGYRDIEDEYVRKFIQSSGESGNGLDLFYYDASHEQFYSNTYWKNHNNT